MCEMFSGVEKRERGTGQRGVKLVGELISPWSDSLYSNKRALQVAMRLRWLPWEMKSEVWRMRGRRPPAGYPDTDRSFIKRAVKEQN